MSGADHTTSTTLEFPYRRSLGDVMGAFMNALAEHRILASKTASGRVLCPPMEADPNTGECVQDDLVEVGPGGTVTGWAWVSTPTARHPLSHPFAMALVQLDGADTALVHAVDAGSIDAMSTGMRVTPRWAEEKTGMITDIAAFVPEGGAQ